MGRPIEKLNALQISRLAKVVGVHGDGGGLSLRVSSKQASSWIFRYMLGGAAREMGFGPYPDVSLADARALAAAARRQKAHGVDPLEARRTARRDAALERAKAITFKTCADSYIESMRPSWSNAKHADQWENTLRDYAFPTIGELPVQAIDVGLIYRVIEPLWRQKTETASRLRGRIEKILDWATVRGFREGDNPARWTGHLDKLLPAKGKTSRTTHHAALPFSQTRSFFDKLNKQVGSGSLALQLVILTAARTSEVIEARWEEFDLDRAVWTVPAKRMKTKKEHRVPLSGPALALLSAQKRAAEGSDFVFPGRSRAKSLSNMSMLQVLRRMGRDDLTVHGFRSTFRDWCSESTSFSRDECEMALAHTIGNKVEGAYRRGDLLEKRRELMEAWARFCTGPSARTPRVSHPVAVATALERQS